MAFESLLENASSQYHYMLYVVTAGSEIPPSSKAKLKRIVKRYPNSTLEFRKVDVDFDEEWQHVNQGHYSKEIFFKLLPARIFTEHEWIVCSDVDVVFEGDVSEIKSFLRSSDYLAGVRSVKKLDQYKERAYDNTLREAMKGSVGAGLLAYNLKKIRRDEMESRLLSNLKEYSDHVVQPEQDVLNLTFADGICGLPLRFMFCTYLYSAVREGPLDLSVAGNWGYYLTKQYNREIESGGNWSADEIRKAFRSPIQVHYAGPRKPWNTLFCYQKLLWLRYLMGTGYFVEHIIQNESQNVAEWGRRVIRAGLSYLSKLKGKVARYLKTIGS